MARLGRAVTPQHRGHIRVVPRLHPAASGEAPYGIDEPRSVRKRAFQSERAGVHAAGQNGSQGASRLCQGFPAAGTKGRPPIQDVVVSLPATKLPHPGVVTIRPSSRSAARTLRAVVLAMAY
jgi:hypothetical protein